VLLGHAADPFVAFDAHGGFPAEGVMVGSAPMRSATTALPAMPRSTKSMSAIYFLYKC
jgi:hypothetical protein